MNALLILNPASRSGRGQARWGFWESGLRAAGATVRSVVTDSIAAATDLARQPGDCDTVVAVGGDGTISRVLDGVLQSGRPELRLGVLYSGTSPDFCRFHGIPVAPAPALATLLAGHTRRVDAICIHCHDHTAQAFTVHAGCGANVGLGAAVARRANRLRPQLGDGCGTGLAALWAVLTARPAGLAVEVDGVRLPLDRVTNISVLKSLYMASGLRVNADLRPADGRIAVLAVPASGLLRRLRRLAGFYSGAIAGAPGVLLRYGRSVVIRSAAPQELEFDGDPRAWLPARFVVRPRCLPLIAPEART